MDPDIKLDEVTVFTLAGKYLAEGYICTSNKYNHISRCDREDWMHYLAKNMHCTVADFFRSDGKGPCMRWKEHYIRVHSEDTLTVHPQVFKAIKSGRIITPLT